MPLLFSKSILQIEKPWAGDHEEEEQEEEDYDNIFNVLATDTSIDFGGENGIYPANGGPLRFTLAGFSGIDYSKRVQIELSSMDGKENVSIEADFQGEETTARKNILISMNLSKDFGTIIILPAMLQSQKTAN